MSVEIPGEWVEKAARAGVASLNNGLHEPLDFDDADSDDRAQMLAYHRDIIAAVADDIRAQAWDEGHDSGLRNFEVAEDGEYEHNPYRARAEEVGND